MTLITAQEQAQKETITLSEDHQKFIKKIVNPFTFRLYMLFKLPLGLLSGMKIKYLDATKCITTVPYGWMTRNPFKSTYFAALSMAAEASNGSMALMAVYKRNPSVAVIIVGMESEFIKMAKDTTTFTCEDGYKLFDAVEETLKTGEPATATLTTVGRSEDGTEVARFRFTWSFKRRG